MSVVSDLSTHPPPRRPEPFRFAPIVGAQLACAQAHPRAPSPPKPASRRRPRAAFTIVEVMIAAGVMALVLASAVTTMQSAFMALDAARNVTSAGQIMQSELEKMRLKDWSVVNAYAAGPTAVTIDSSFTSNPAIGTRFALTRTVADVHTDMKSITLTIAWKSYDGRPYSRSYQTYYGRNGLYDYFYNSN